MVPGVGCWVVSNVAGDRQGSTNITLTLIGIGGGLAKQGGTNIALTLIDIGGGLAKQEGSTIKSENIENVDVEKG